MGGVRNNFFGRLALLIVCMVCAVSAIAQTRTITGTVSDEAGEPMTGVTVRVKGTDIVTATNIDGMFSIKAARGAIFDFTYIGYLPQSIAIGDHTQIDITMQADVKSLDEVVVVAYGAQKKSSITGAISQVKSEEIAKRPVTSVTAALEGTTPGITVTGNYGTAGSEPSIYIRGVGTVNGSTSPLYVIDGVPFGGNISDLNPEDIESMSVLKDAASAALYGNRASNGVILITTKKSKAERVQFTFKTNQGWYERALPEYECVTPQEFMKVYYQNYANAYVKDSDGKVTYADKKAIHDYVTADIFGADKLNTNIFTERDATKLYDLDGNVTSSILSGYADDLDWFDQATRKGYRGEYLFSGSGATSRSDYYFSLSYLNEEGYMKDNNFNRFTGRASVNINPIKWLKAGLNINATHQKYNNTANGDGDGASSYNNPFYFCRYMAPIYPVHQHYVEDATILDDQGKEINVKAGDLVGQTYKGYDTGSYEITNPDGTTQEIFTRNQNRDRHVIMESELNRKRSIRNTMNSVAYTDFVLPYGVTATLKGNLNTRNTEAFSYGSAEIGDSKARNGSFSKTMYNYKNWTFMQQLRWNYMFNNIHTIEVLLGHENYSYLYDYTYVAKSNQAFPNIYALSNFSEMASSDGYRSRYRTESYLARVQYNFDNRYNLEASIRRDGSSRFHKDSRWGTFGSIGANWIFSAEEFMKDVTWLNNGKLRADWGQVGNDAGSGYYGYYALFGSWTENSKPAYVMSQLPAGDLKWETGESWGIALEGRLFNRANVSLEYYDKRNKDLIFNVYSPTSAGPTSTSSSLPTTSMNIGTMSNRGFEFSLDVDVFKNRDWTVNVGANLTTLTNKIVKLPEQNKKLTTLPVDESIDIPRGITSGSQFITEGKSRYEWYTYHWAGTDMMDGRSLYDANLVDYHIKQADGTIIGGKWKIDDEGNPALDANGDRQLGSTELTAENYRLINGKYYVVNTTYAQKKWAGQALPKVYGAFNASVRWKGLSVSAMFSYSLGGKVYDSNYSSLMGVGSSPSNVHKDILNSWFGTPEGMTEDSPNRINRDISHEINYNNNTQNHAGSDRWLTSRSYLCFKNINVTYALPKTVTQFLHLGGVQASFAAENLHTWGARRGMNPMMGLNGGQSNYLVPARVFTFGLNVNI